MAKKKKKRKSPDWREFEQAVARFVTAIGQGVRVTHDAKIPDAETGLPRQRDVWVEWSVAGHYPTKALISCKYWNKSLDQNDIDHFRGEFLSSNAQVGIIYARNGFNENAIEKSKELGFHCCKLYRNQPADLPAGLIIDNVFHLKSACTICTKGLQTDCKFTHWKEFFSLPAGDATVLERLVNTIDQFQQVTNNMDTWRKVREGHTETIGVEPKGLAPFAVVIHCIYRIFAAKIEYTMLNGSYNITYGDFVGRQTFPVIDSQSLHPGPGWRLIESIPDPIPRNYLAVFAVGDWQKEFTAFGEKPFPGKIDATLSEGNPTPAP